MNADPEFVIEHGIGLGNDNPYQWGFLCFLLLSIIITLFNGLVIAAIIRDHALRSSIHNLLVAGQTLTVLGYGIFILIYSAINLSTNPVHFWGGQRNCNIIGILTVVFIAASSLYLLLIAWVRYRSIILNQSFSIRQWIAWSIAVWLVSIINPIYFWIIADMRLVPSGTRCLPDWTNLAISIPAIIQTSIFFITFTIVYVKCIKYIRSAELKYSATPEVTRYLSHQRRLTHQMIAIVMLFCITSLPEVLQWFIEMVVQRHQSAAYDMLSAILVLVHSIINPFVYIFMSARIRNSCLHLLSYIFPCFHTHLKHLHHHHKHMEMSPRVPERGITSSTGSSGNGTRNVIDLDPIRPTSPMTKPYKEIETPRYTTTTPQYTVRSLDEIPHAIDRSPSSHPIDELIQPYVLSPSLPSLPSSHEVDHLPHPHLYPSSSTDENSV